MEVGKEQQAQARRGTGFHCTRRTFWALLSSAEVVRMIRCGVKRFHGVWQAQPMTVIASDKSGHQSRHALH